MLEENGKEKFATRKPGFEPSIVYLQATKLIMTGMWPVVRSGTTTRNVV